MDLVDRLQILIQKLRYSLDQKRRKIRYLEGKIKMLEHIYGSD